MSKVKMVEWDNDKYQNDKEYMRATALKLACESMFKYEQYLNEEDKDTPAKLFGRLYHCIMEERDTQDDFIILDPSLRPDLDHTMNSKANKEWKAILEANAEKFKKDIVKLEDLEKAKSMRKVLDRYVKKGKSGKGIKVIEEFISKAKAEATLLCDDYLGMKIKVRPDLTLPYATIDFKSVASAQPHDIDRAVRKFGWDVQIALYSDLTSMYYNNLDRVPDEIVHPFYIIAQEKNEPYDFTVYNVSAYYNGGKAKLLRGMKNIIEDSENTGLWGKIPASEIGTTLRPPAWAYAEYDIVEDNIKSASETFNGEWEDDEIIGEDNEN